MNTAPTGQLQKSKVCLPELVGTHLLVLELVRRLDDHEGRTGDQITLLENMIGSSL